MSYIWENAKFYNEDGSEMYNLAEEFEVCASVLASEGEIIRLMSNRGISNHYSQKQKKRLRSLPDHD